jgi:hypothetical protein
MLDRDSDLDTSGEDDIQIEEERQGYEEDDDKLAETMELRQCSKSKNDAIKREQPPQSYHASQSTQTTAGRSARLVVDNTTRFTPELQNAKPSAF